MDNNIKNKYIKSPLNYTGGKYKLLDDILPFAHTAACKYGLDTFLDIFGGGGNVCVNAPVEYTNIVYNDAMEPLVNMIREMEHRNTNELESEIYRYIREYRLDRENEDGYLALRKDYNTSADKHPLMLFTLVAHGFSNQIRFNSNGEYNIPFGRRTYNDMMKANFRTFATALSNRHIDILCGNYKVLLDNKNIKWNKTMVYADPPYLGSSATYNERNGWTLDDEKELLLLLDDIAARGAKFMLSNNLKYGNALLEKWAGKYITIHLRRDYSTCNYHKKNKSKDSEILVKNF